MIGIYKEVILREILNIVFRFYVFCLTTSLHAAVGTGLQRLKLYNIRFRAIEGDQQQKITLWGPGFRTVLFKLFLFNVGDGSEGSVGTAVVVLIILLLLSPTVALAVCWTW